MQISGMLGGTAPADLSGPSAFLSLSGSRDPFDSALYDLASSVHSSNLSYAQKYLSEIKQMLPSDADLSSPLGKFLNDMSDAISSNNLAAAKSALSTLESYLTADKAANYTPTVYESSSSDSAPSMSSSEAIGEQVYEVFKAIDQGDMNDVQSAYDRLTAQVNLLAYYCVDVGAIAPSINALLQGVSSAIDNDNLSIAQNAMDNYLQSASTGSILSLTV